MIKVKKNGLATLVNFDILIEKILKFLLNLLPYLFINTITHGLTFYGSLNDADTLQFFQVLGNGSLRQAQFIHQIITYTGMLTDDVLEDSDPGRVAQYLKQCGQSILVLSKNF